MALSGERHSLHSGDLSAKSMFELADAERKAGWTDAARRHYRSAFRACEDLLSRLDDIETEGEMTPEQYDYVQRPQMGLAGLRTTDPELRRRYAEAARYMMEKHRCLEQRLIPDCGCAVRRCAIGKRWTFISCRIG